MIGVGTILLSKKKIKCLSHPQDSDDSAFALEQVFLTFVKFLLLLCPCFFRTKKKKDIKKWKKNLRKGVSSFEAKLDHPLTIDEVMKCGNFMNSSVR